MTKKRKKLTNKEKAFRASMKKEMQKEGLLPPEQDKAEWQKVRRRSHTGMESERKEGFLDVLPV